MSFYILGSIRQSVAHNPTGGMEAVTHDLYKGLVLEGFEVEVVTSSIDDSTQQVDIDGVKYLFAPNSPKGMYSQELHQYNKDYLEYKISQGKRPLVIHSASGAAAALTKNQYGIPVVASWHGTNIEQDLDRMMSYVYLDKKTLLPSHCADLLLKTCNNYKLSQDFQSFDGHIAISSFMKECILSYGVPESKVAVIQNSLPEYFFLEEKKSIGFQKPKDKVLLGLVGRSVPMKGHDFFIEVINKLDPNKYELIVISGNTNKDLFKDCKMNIHFVSEKRENMPYLYSLMDIYVNPTFRYSGFDLTVQEALVSGTVVLNSNVKPYANYYNELNSLFGNNSPFFIFNVGDTTSCANAINYIANNGIKNQQIDHFLNRYKMKNMISNYISFFSELNK
ncbi:MULTISPECIES: glycosyltransferase family 4 protein [Glaesserella]|uniref:Glycosyltransferase subfamily 4-like N-terminal domain-containing protein n=1 Tax=Glaesserella australis TaxID=2094024 RepID=A0A328BYT0_9PAST|nr:MULTISPECIES: glycosyltransferase family 4 protein [Glaesserella]AUI66413.1 hypothetical protein CJD39_07370 [Glaesserella sp. 15-184]RAL19373.1 hypothetical protein C5N92_02695 [Glaesserella australis]